MAEGEERPPIVTFRREAFHSESFRNTVPKWHLARVDGGRWGTYEAWCGYARSNILGELKVSRSKTPKKAAETCGKCVAALTRHERRSNHADQ